MLAYVCSRRLEQPTFSDASFPDTLEVKPDIRSKTNSMEMISSWPFISTCAVSKNKY